MDTKAPNLNYICGDKLSFFSFVEKANKSNLFFFFFFIHGPLYYSNLLMWRLGPEILNIELQCVSFRIKGVNLILGAVPV